MKNFDLMPAALYSDYEVIGEGFAEFYCASFVLMSAGKAFLLTMTATVLIFR